MKYHVVVTRDGDGWMADVPALPGTHTWAKTLRALDRVLVLDGFPAGPWEAELTFGMDAVGRMP